MPAEQELDEQTPAPAFVMVGAADAGLCVDGVCALPASATPESPAL